ncbi:hypothetical protein BCAH1134_C0121 (plasmid) [Bacillus cereus AH1134]|nr:hypothetical protein BCAH1134_C0121 [Bacillus cereus AH1134]
MNKSLLNVFFILKSASLLILYTSFHLNHIKIKMVQVRGWQLRVSFLYG